MNEEMTMADAVLAAERLAEFDAEIKKFAEKRDAVIDYANSLIAKANKDFEEETYAAREEIAYQTELLRQFAPSILPKNKKSVNIARVQCSFRKSEPKYFIGDIPADKFNPALIDFVKANAPEYLKTKVEEYVDWAAFKDKLTGDEEQVYFVETGEAIEGLRMQILPDKFTVKIA